MQRRSVGVPMPIHPYEIPAYRTMRAAQAGVDNNLMISTWGGIGDQICAEPTMRYALNTFKKQTVTLASELPELFGHLKFHDVYDIKKEKPITDDFLVFETMTTVDHLSWQFIGHMVTNCVDCCSLNAFRCQLPIADRNVVLKPAEPSLQILHDIAKDRHQYVIVHAGRHWESKTFPVDWWDATLDSIIAEGFTPVLIGKEGIGIDAGQGTVQTKTEGCVDLRGKTTLMETIWLLQNSAVVVCNDSSPLHMAVTGNAWIGLISTVKHPDYVTHWRKNLKGVNEWSWRMDALNVGGFWDHYDPCPNQAESLQVDKCPEALLRTWLPESKSIGPWCKEKMNAYLAEV